MFATTNHGSMETAVKNGGRSNRRNVNERSSAHRERGKEEIQCYRTWSTVYMCVCNDVIAYNRVLVYDPTGHILFHILQRSDAAVARLFLIRNV